MTRTAFKIPLQTEVQAYMKNRMGWPDQFCIRYAEKFWNHYQASGWKLSSGNSIKDWQAAFNSQWKTPKFKDDIELLNGLMGKKTNGTAVNTGTDFERLDQFLSEYALHPTEVKFEKFGQWYDFMKENKLLMQMNKGQVSDIRAIYGEDNGKCRCACVQMTLDGFARSGWTIARVMEVRNRLNKAT